MLMPGIKYNVCPSIIYYRSSSYICFIFFYLHPSIYEYISLSLCIEMLIVRIDARCTGLFHKFIFFLFTLSFKTRQQKKGITEEKRNEFSILKKKIKYPTQQSSEEEKIVGTRYNPVPIRYPYGIYLLF
jgi:hypothetical protein